MSDVGPALYVCPAVLLIYVGGGVFIGLVRERDIDLTTGELLNGQDLGCLLLPPWLGYKLGKWLKGKGV